jgi:hypothetical protein
MKAERLADTLCPDDGEVLAAAAWLHDIGYAPDLVETGFHPLDGGRWLRQNGFDQRLCALVAHHSCALFEASERGLGEDLSSEFAQECSPTADALWYVDLTTGPEGQDFDVMERLSEIRARYGRDHLVTKVWASAEPTALEAVRRTQARLAGQPM